MCMKIVSHPKTGEIENILGLRKFSQEKCKVSFAGRKKSKSSMQHRDKPATVSRMAGKGYVGQS